MLNRKAIKVCSRSVLWQSKRFSAQEAAVPAVVERTAKYPFIYDVEYLGRKRHERQLWYDKLKSLRTVEQKMLEMTSSRIPWFPLYIVRSVSPTFAGVPFHNFITRTHILSGLPQSIQDINVEEDYQTLKKHMWTAVGSHFSNAWREEKFSNWTELLRANHRGGQLVNDLLSVCCRALAWKAPYLTEAAYDYQPHLKSFWWHGGFEPSENPKQKKRMVDQTNEKNLCFQFLDQPYFSVRVKKRLPSVVPLNDPLCFGEVEQYQYQPVNFGIPYKHRHLTCLPGFWPGSECDLPFLLVHTTDNVDYLKSKVEHCDYRDIDEAYGAMASFGWLNGLAFYQGFTPYHDLTYPLVAQTILTNGQDWTFFVYQLNTITFHSDLDQKDKRNLCWASEKMRLFDTIENGELKGMNEEVFKTFLKFMLNVPTADEDIQLKPYLGEDTRTPEEIIEMRKNIMRFYKNKTPIKAHHWEVPLWQHIYKRHPDAPPMPFTKLK